MEIVNHQSIDFNFSARSYSTGSQINENSLSNSVNIVFHIKEKCYQSLFSHSGDVKSKPHFTFDRDLIQKLFWTVSYQSLEY